MKEFFGTQMPKLGFGLMRLPRLEDGKTIDVEQCKVMTDKFIDAGMKYFDTAYVYEGSEAATKQFLVDRYPRENYYLTSKLNAGDWMKKSEEELKNELKESLERTGAGYFDFYLLHALGRSNYKNYEKYGIWDFVKDAKEKGLIRHFGFSFHDSAELLDEILTAHPETEFVQLQINYADWEDPEVQSRANYEVCVKHNKPVVIMEPVKGGTLAVPPAGVKEILETAEPDMSCASWAIRFAASLEQVMVVLSGMSNIAQMEDNLSYMKDFKSLSEAEDATIHKAMDKLASYEQIKCTGCRYCTKGCPMQIHIPDVFKAMNRLTVFEDEAGAKKHFEFATSGEAGDPSACIHCLQCEDACPQHLPITELLEKATQVFQG